MICVAGIDIGSRTTKAAVMDCAGNLRGRAAVRTRPNFGEVATEALVSALVAAGMDREQIAYVATTGLGRYNVAFRDIQVTEVTCDGRGAAFLLPSTRCVLDIGFQSSRAMRLGREGKVKAFASNDRCAAGAGGFLERAARILEVPLEELGGLSLEAAQAEPVSSVCAVLAESEIITRITEGRGKEEIIRGIHESLASRAQSLLRRVGIDGGVTFIGGVARQRGMVRALEEKLGVKVLVPEGPEFVGAIGAALVGLRRMEKLGRAPSQNDVAGSRQAHGRACPG
jgi:predicted CoA-substrate-specific enzyme activase